MIATTGLWDSVGAPTSFSTNAVACVRSLGSQNDHAIVASEHDDVSAFASRSCDETPPIPLPNDDFPAYENAPPAVAPRFDVRKVGPTREMDAYNLSKCRSEVAEGSGVPTPKTETLDAVGDWGRKLIAKQRCPILAERCVDCHESGTCEGRVESRDLESVVEPETETKIERRRDTHFGLLSIDTPHRFVRGVVDTLSRGR
ncbi:hypothetical protein [Haloprofundus halobius]|uniref:hypothetical protein n=1 Tax=Haloprofundus halobius TaxID=2876194 RepID=UPI001CCC3B4F|nr:hypothetical protein [Haloprofundus halobius]